MHDGPEEGGAGGIGLPVPSVPPEVRPLVTGEVPQSGQDSEQGAQKDTQARCTLPGSPTLHEFERRGYVMCAAIGPGAHQAIPHTMSQLVARCDKIGSEARGLVSSLLHKGFHAMIGALPRGYSATMQIDTIRSSKEVYFLYHKRSSYYRCKVLSLKTIKPIGFLTFPDRPNFAIRLKSPTDVAISRFRRSQSMRRQRG